MHHTSKYNLPTVLEQFIHSAVASLARLFTVLLLFYPSSSVSLATDCLPIPSLTSSQYCFIRMQINGVRHLILHCSLFSKQQSNYFLTRRNFWFIIISICRLLLLCSTQTHALSLVLGQTLSSSFSPLRWLFGRLLYCGSRFTDDESVQGSKIASR